MKKQNLRIGVRIPKQLREEIDEAISSGKFNNLSQLIRQAVENLLKEGMCI